MRLGYVSTANSLGCKANRRFRLASYSEQRLLETVESNLACLSDILRFNVHNNLLFFRISSDLVPFASHPICRIDWRDHVKTRLAEVGAYIRDHGIRISMHPGQYTLLNSPNRDILRASIAELTYHSTLLDGLELDTSAKIQIHVGGIYGDKGKAMDAFCAQWERLDARLKSRLVIENDDVRFSLQDCLAIHSRIGIPVIFDTLHHECLGNAEPVAEALRLAQATWGPADGEAMVDYSSQQPGRRPGTHADTLDVGHFRRFLHQSQGLIFDLMLELRDKETSALRATSFLRR